MPTFKISRRTVLRGTLGGAAVSFGLPPLEAMFNANGTALAQGAALPKRLGIFAWGGGIKRDRWIPAATGAGWALTPELEPFAMVKDYINIVTGMHIKTGNPQGHHAGWGGIFSGSPLVVQPKGSAPFRSTFSTKSVDQFAADAIGKDTKFKSLEVGISQGLNGAEGTTLKYLSHNGPDLPITAIYDPPAVFERVFGAGFTPPNSPAMPVVDHTKALKKSVMDAVLADLTSLRLRVSTSDRLRLDQHLENVRKIETRLGMENTILPAACKLPTKPASIMDTRGREMLEERTKAMSELIAVALACDQTRVFSMLFSGSTNTTVYWQVGVSAGHHGLTHDEGGNQPQVHATVVYTMKLFAYLLEALKNIPEGAGNILDNCAIYGSSDLSDGKAHDIIDYPIVIAGGGGGYLKTPGWHYRSPSPGTSNAENTNNALLTVLRAAGVTDATGGPLKQFGGGAAMTTTSISAIEK